MNGRDFCFWLRGMLAANGEQGLSKEQVDTIKAELKKMTEPDPGQTVGVSGGLHGGGLGPTYRC
jgi:hypothetical protein